MQMIVDGDDDSRDIYQTNIVTGMVQGNPVIINTVISQPVQSFLKRGVQYHFDECEKIKQTSNNEKEALYSIQII